MDAQNLLVPQVDVPHILANAGHIMIDLID